MNDRWMFRGKRKDNGEWAVGLLDATDTNEIAFKPKHYIRIPGVDGRYNTAYQVDPATVGQCTGLRDRDGTLIFEGDKLTARYPLSQGYYFGTSAIPAVFEIKHEDACLCAHNNNEHRFFIWELEDVEIIGTIYDEAEAEDAT